MAVSNLVLTHTPLNNLKPGDSVTFKLTWSGSTNWKDPNGTTLVSNEISLISYDGFKALPTISKSYFNGSQSYSFVHKIPANWAGSVKGYFYVTWSSNGITTETANTLSDTVNVIGNLNPTITLTPSNPTIGPEDKVSMSANVSGVALPYDVSYFWNYDNSRLTSTSKTLNLEFDRVGVYDLHCDVTITKPGYATKSYRGITKVNNTLGSLEGIGVMISNMPHDVDIGQPITAEASVSNVPAGSKVSYAWTVNGIAAGTTKDLNYKPSSGSVHKVVVNVSVQADNYKGISLSSPPISVVVNKLQPNKIEESGDKNRVWGYVPNNKVIEMWISTYLSTSDSNYFVNLNRNKPYSVDVDGSPVETDIYISNLTYRQKFNSPKMINTPEKWRFKYTTEGSSVVLPMDVDYTATVKATPNSYFEAGGVFYVDDVKLASTLQIQSAPNKDMSFKIYNLMDPRDNLPAKYRSDLVEVASEGKYELIDFKGNVVATAVNGVFTYRLPSEVKTMTGKIRHTMGAPYFTRTVVAEADIVIEIVDTPMVPYPTSKIIQTPNPVRLSDRVEFNREFKDLPEGAVTSKVVWLMNNSPVSNSEKLSVTANFDNPLIKNETTVIPLGASQGLVEASITPNVIGKLWPALDITLSPNRTTIPWGEYLLVGYKVIGQESMDPVKLVIMPPVWHIDGHISQSISPDGSLAIQATSPGEHEIKAVITVRHPDYENGEITIEKQFNITTEKREMATTLKLLPNDAVIGIGKTQKFSAELTGAPVDAVTTYVWEVDSVAQSSVTNNMDYTASSEGAKVVKVTSTTKAEDAEDDIQTAQVTLTVNKNTMTVSIVSETPTPAIKVGDEWSATCTVTGAPAGATIAYAWTSGETTASISGTATTVGNITNKCKVTVKAADYDDFVKDTNTVTIVVSKRDQVTTAVAATSTPSIKQLQKYKADVTVTDAPAGATTTYLWSTGETTKSVEKVASLSGDIDLSCVVTVKATDYEDKVITTNAVKIVVEQIEVQGASVSLEVTPTPVKPSVDYTVDAKVVIPTGTNAAFLWNTGETTASITVSNVAGTYTHSVEVTVTHPDFKNKVLTDSVEVEIDEDAPVIPDTCPLTYVHPLPHRGTAYIWCGWWIMDAIEAITAEGKDWKTNYIGTPYECHLGVLATMLADYPEVDVQESRNGRIVHRSALDVGIIY